MTTSSLNGILSFMNKAKNPTVARIKTHLQSTISAVSEYCLWFPAELQLILLAISRYGIIFNKLLNKKPKASANNITEPRKSRGLYIFSVVLGAFPTYYSLLLLTESQVNQTSFESLYFRIINLLKFSNSTSWFWPIMSCCQPQLCIGAAQSHSILS